MRRPQPAGAAIVPWSTKVLAQKPSDAGYTRIGARRGALRARPTNKLLSVMGIEFVTAADERARCSVSREDTRCSQPTALRFTARGCDEHEQELYVYCCSDCAAEVADFLGPDYVATFLDDQQPSCADMTTSAGPR